MKQMRANYTLLELCEALQLSTSGYYKWSRAQKLGPRELANRTLLEEIRRIRADRHLRAYGSPRMARELQDRGLACSENRVARLMAKEGLRARGRRPFRPRTTQKDREAIPAPNRLAQAPPARAPGEALVGDITYVATREGWLYLAVVIDLYSRAVLGWKLSDSLESTIVLEALNDARRACPRLPDNAIFHSDQGCQYTSGSFRRCLREHDLIQSMSAKGYCYDNAFAESFFATIKSEAFPDNGLFDSKAEARRAIFDYLETFYNHRRLHSSLNFNSPQTVFNNYFQNTNLNLN